jgi:class 3 adenylate cyclase
VRPPETRYATTADGLHIAYQLVGEGQPDLVCDFSFATHLDGAWEQPMFAAWFERLSSFARLVVLDHRGSGLSDPTPTAGPPTLEDRVEDIRAVLEAGDIQRASLFVEGPVGPVGLLFTATYPDRVSSLVLYGTLARLAYAPDYPMGVDRESFERYVSWSKRNWGSGKVLSAWAPSLAGQETALERWGRMDRGAMSPGQLEASLWAAYESDVRAVLPQVRVPTLILHRRGDPMIPLAYGRYLAEHIPEAKFVELDGADHTVFVGDSEEIASEIEEVLTGSRPVTGISRVLATVLFTDIVSSTEHLAARGDRDWARLLAEHDALVNRELERHRGHRVQHTGDGILATFDGPARAVRCAQAIIDAVRPLGIEVRAGLHTGEVELRREGIGGIAVHIGQRVSALARASEVLVSRTITDLVAGSGLTFEDRGEHQLKGVPGRWAVYALAV